MNEKELATTIKQDINGIISLMDSFESQQKKNLEQIKEVAGIEPTRLLRVLLEWVRDGISVFVEKPDSNQAILIMSFLPSLPIQAEAIASRLEIASVPQVGIPSTVQQAAAAASSMWNTFAQKIKSVIQSICATLWSLISKYLNLKEWSVKGQISTPAITSLFGITGSLDVEFTFEK